MGLGRIYERYKIYRMHKNYENILERIRKQKQKKVIFLISFIQEWNKFQKVYFEFLKHSEFEVKVFVCPTINLGIDYCVEEYKRSLEYFQHNNLDAKSVFKNGNFRDLSDSNLLDIKCI